jgi:transposase
VDDFAFRKGRRNGTLLSDLDRDRPIDVLSDREGKTLEDWLRDHPGIELITATAARSPGRDRSNGYASAITRAAPEAVQVVDCWHLLTNLSEVVERFWDTHREAINGFILATLSLVESTMPVLPITEEELPQSLTWNHDLMTTSSKEGTSKRQQA